MNWKRPLFALITAVANPGQEDTDGDGGGDACEEL